MWLHHVEQHTGTLHFQPAVLLTAHVPLPASQWSAVGSLFLRTPARCEHKSQTARLSVFCLFFFFAFLWTPKQTLQIQMLISFYPSLANQIMMVFLTEKKGAAQGLCHVPTATTHDTGQAGSAWLCAPDHHQPTHPGFPVPAPHTDGQASQRDGQTAVSIEIPQGICEFLG